MFGLYEAWRCGCGTVFVVQHGGTGAGVETGNKVNLKKDPQSVYFTPTKTGAYPMYCDQKPLFGGKSHRERGMEGVIEVEE